MDTLSTVLETVRVTGATFSHFSATAPWSPEWLSVEQGNPTPPKGSERLIALHIVKEGRCRLGIPGGETYELGAGDVAFLARGDPLLLSCESDLHSELPGGKARSLGIFLASRANLTRADALPVKLTSWFLACDAKPFNPVIEILPRIIIEDSKVSGSMPWLANLVRYAVGESSRARPGGESVLCKLAELMFIEVVRQYADRFPLSQSGWLAGLRDPVVSRALSAMHGEPGRSWGIENLARLAGSSRSELIERFTSFIGIPPKQYLAKWRMQLAAGLLRDGLNIAAVAIRVGYGSEASFSRAFKKIVGMPPSAWRYHADHRKAA